MWQGLSRMARATSHTASADEGDRTHTLLPVLDFGSSDSSWRCYRCHEAAPDGRCAERGEAAVGFARTQLG